MALRVDARDGLVLLAAAPYDDCVVEWIRTLPERHYRPREQAWCVPARREQIRHVCALIGELEERDVAVDISRQRERPPRAHRTGARDPARRRHRDHRAIQPAPTTCPARAARTPLRPRAPNLDDPAHTRRRAGSPRPRRPHSRTRHHSTRAVGAATVSNPHRLHAGRNALPQSGGDRSEAAIAHRALAPLHERTDLREPRPRARARSGHRAVRTDSRRSRPAARPTPLLSPNIC